MPTPLQFLQQYRNLRVKAGTENAAARVSQIVFHRVQLRNYFMMDWEEGTEERRDFNEVTRGSRSDAWFKANKSRILNAAMGKGAPLDYELALEWAVRSGKVSGISQAAIQTYCDEHLGIDCSGFVTNYLAACGKKVYSDQTVRNTGAASYFQVARAVNEPTAVQQGDLLVWMRGNSVMRGPGHVAVVQAFSASSRVGGNLHVVEATGSSRADPKLLDSMYTVEGIIDRGGAVPVMILVVKRHGVSGSRVAVMRW